MPPFVGVALLDSRAVGRADRDALLEAAQTWPQPPAVLESEFAVFLQGGESPAAPAAGGCLFAGAAFLHNPEEIAAALGRRAGDGDLTLLQNIFEARGDAGLAQLRGAFSFAHWNGARRELTLARDCGRGKSLFLHRAKDHVIFASHLPDLLAHPSVPRVLDETAMAGFLTHDAFQYRSTFFREVERVPTRHAVTIGRDGIRHRAYWAPSFHERPLYRREEDYVARGRELLDQAVSRTVRDNPRFAVMASGGLDSSAIVSTLARSGRAPIVCYTMVTDPQSAMPTRAGRYADERAPTEALARMYPALHFSYVSGTDLQAVAAPDEARFAQRGRPQRNISRARFGNKLSARIAADGFDVLLGGGGGNFGLTWPGTHLLPFLARRGELIALLREAHASARGAKVSTLRVLARELLLPSLPLGLRRAVKRGRTDDPFSLHGDTPLRREVVAELGLPQLWAEDGFDPLYPWPSSAPQDRARWLFDRAQLAHDNFSAPSTMRDLELRNPLADRDLLEFALNVPETHYRRGGVQRWFARQVLADRVPAQILQERRRGALRLPWFEALSARRAEIAAEVARMENSQMAGRLFDVPRLKRLVEDWPADAGAAEAQRHAYMLSLEQAVYMFQFIRWATKGNF